MMLSFFPWLFTYEAFAPFLLRLTLGGIFLFWAYRKAKQTVKESEDKTKSKKLAWVVIEGILGILLVLGLFTQLAALLATVVFLIHLVRKIKSRSFLTNGMNYYFILLIISLCLLLSGPGAFSLDFPL